MRDKRIELTLADADGAIAFETPAMARAFRQVVHGWPKSTAAAPEGPIAEVTRSGRNWQVEFLRPMPRRKDYHPVNGICDLIVELNWSRLRQRTDLMCLHAAGIRIGDALLVLPSQRRAGKSTLTAELARRGCEVFSDDILAVELDPGGIPCGIATGIAPRLRLPLPSDAPIAFAEWVAADRGPENRQYKYLIDAPVARYGASLGLGAVVTLERVEEATAPSLTRMDPADVIPVLIYQNFGRFVHSGRALAAFEAIARDLPCLRLTYHNFGEAADLLEREANAGRLMQTASAGHVVPGTPDFDYQVALFDPTLPYRQRAGFRAVETGGQAFVADASGIGIFKLGAGMLPIWRLLEEPMDLLEIVAVLSEVFPSVPLETLRQDADRALRDLNRAALIEPI